MTFEEIFDRIDTSTPQFQKEVRAWIEDLLRKQRETCVKRVALESEHCDLGHFHDSEELAEWLKKAACNVSTTPLVEF